MAHAENLAAHPHRPRGFSPRFPVRRDRRRPLRYRVVSGVLRVAFRSYFRGRLRITGVENIPVGGPILLAINHLSNLDPPMLGAFTPGANFAMAKRELFAHPAVAWMWAGCNVFPVDRGSADRWALRTALEVLTSGGRLMIWIEGTRAASAGMQRAEPGVGFLLRRHNVPVVPVAFTGTEDALVRGRRLPRRVPINLHYGPPIELDIAGVRDNQAVADQVGAAVAALLPAAYRGYYATSAR